MQTKQERAGRRARVLLALGAILGLVCAAGSLIAPRGPGKSELPPGALATVNGETIRLEEYERALAALAADRRNVVGDAERLRVLDRLIEEELLIQRAIELGFVRRDQRVRAGLVSSVIQAVVSEAAATEPKQEEVEAFYRQNRDYFTQPGRLRLRQILVRIGGARAPDQALVLAREVAERLRAGEPFLAVKRELGDREVASLPDGFLPPKKLREYLGPAAARAALALEPGAVSDPVRTAAGMRVLQVLEREPERTPPLEEIEADVRAQLRRRAGDRALRDYLDELRKRAEIRIAQKRAESRPPDG